MAPVHDLATTVAKLLAIGLPLEEYIEAITNRPRSVLGLHSTAPLALDAHADFTVFNVEPTDSIATDSLGCSAHLSTHLIPSHAALGAVLFETSRAA